MNEKFIFPCSKEEREKILQKYGEYLEINLSEKTRLLYQKACRLFERYCDSMGIQAFPTSPMTLLDFAHINVTEGLQGRPLSMNTVDLYLKAIHYKNIQLGFRSPYHDYLVTRVLRGMRRKYGTASKKAKALLASDVKKMIDACDNSLIGKRDSAIMAIGLAAALRRSEIINIRIEDIEIVKRNHPTDPERAFLHIRQSKTDQEGKGRKIPVIQGENIQAIKRINEWLQVSGIESGYLFQTIRQSKLTGNPLDGKDIPRLLKHYAEMIGLDSTMISGHSLRAGFVTNATMVNARQDKIMAVSRHSSRDSLSRYIRDEDYFTDHAGEEFL